jgi:alpha-ribazole phosphatase
MTTTFTLLRHGQVSGAPALYGHTNISLSEHGYTLMCAAIERINESLTIDRVVTSPLTRCAKVAKLISVKYAVPLHIVNDLAEMHFGDWDGVAFDQLENRWAQLEAFWQSPDAVQPPNGEQLDGFARRVITAWEKLVTDTSKNINSTHNLVICHGGTIRIIIAHILQIDWRNAALFTQLQINYSSYTRVELKGPGKTQAIIKCIGVC